jgi:hypothetical protein
MSDVIPEAGQVWYRKDDPEKRVRVREVVPTASGDPLDCIVAYYVFGTLESDAKAAYLHRSTFVTSYELFV